MVKDFEFNIVVINKGNKVRIVQDINSESILPNMFVRDHFKEIYIPGNAYKTFESLYDRLINSGYSKVDRDESSLELVEHFLTGETFISLVEAPIPMEVPKIKRIIPESVSKAFHYQLDFFRRELSETENYKCNMLLRKAEEELVLFDQSPSEELEESISESIKQLSQECTELSLHEKERKRELKGKLKYVEV